MTDQPVLTPAAIAAGFDTARAGINRFNLGLFGITGAGKSTLVNAVFGTDIAPTGIGAPVTQASSLYRYETSMLGIYDTKGLELGSNMAAVLTELARFIDANRVGDPADQIHVIWYCVRAGDRRIQPAEEEFIRKVAGLGIPVVLVMTQTPLTGTGLVHGDAAELASAIRGLRLPIRGDIFHVNAVADDFGGVPSHGLDALLEWTSSLAPEGVRNALAAAQRVNARIKREQADFAVDRSAEEIRNKILEKALGESWVAMCATIATIYDFPEDQSQQVLESAPTVLRMRRIISRSKKGAFIFSPPIALAKYAANSSSNIKRRREDKRLAQEAARAAAEGRVLPSGDTAASTSFDPSANQPGGTPPDDGRLASWGRALRERFHREPTAPEGEEPEPERTSIGTGLSSSRVTRALGEAWVETCEYYWSQAYPDPPRFTNPEEVANSFADNLGARIPKPIAFIDDRLNR